jgi:serine/threonine protein kinase
MQVGAMNDRVLAITGSGLELEIPKHIGRYQYVSLLGSGASSVVMEMVNTSTGQHVACKVVSRAFLNETGELRWFEQEVRVHELVSHPNIVKIHEVIFKPDYMFIFLDLCSGGDLLTVMTEQPEKLKSSMRSILHNILSALDYLHSRGIAHRDIKPDNILMTQDGVAKLADFGCCEVIALRKEVRACGTMHYVAPEVILDPKVAGIKSDIWSFGILLFTMVSGHLPWIDGDDDFIYDQISDCRFAIPNALPAVVEKIFTACTAANPGDRASAHELMNNPWFDSKRKASSQSQTQFMPMVRYGLSVCAKRVNVENPRPAACRTKPGALRPVISDFDKLRIKKSRSGALQIRPMPRCKSLTFM